MDDPTSDVRDAVMEDVSGDHLGSGALNYPDDQPMEGVEDSHDPNDQPMEGVEFSSHGSDDHQPMEGVEYSHNPASTNTEMGGGGLFGTEDEPGLSDSGYASGGSDDLGSGGSMQRGGADDQAGMGDTESYTTEAMEADHLAHNDFDPSGDSGVQVADASTQTDGPYNTGTQTDD